MKKHIVQIIITAVFPLLIMGIGCKDSRNTVDDIGKNVVVRSADRASLLKLKKDLQTINRAIQMFHANHGRYPDSLDELARLGIISRIPREPFGGEWNYDSHRGEVTSSSHPEITSSNVFGEL